MSAQSADKKRLKSLIEVLVMLKDPQDLRDFLYDLCTPAELESLSDRWEVAQWVDSSENYRDIAAKTKISTTTITRVGRTLKYGAGGYKNAINRMKSL